MPAAILGRGAHGAARLAHVPAIAEPAPGGETRHLRKAERALIECAYRRGEIAHTGGVDERRAVWQVEEPRGGGGMAALFRAHELTDGNVDLGHETPHQRGLAHTRLPDERGDPAGAEPPEELRHARTTRSRAGEGRISRRDIGVELRSERG